MKFSVEQKPENVFEIEAEVYYDDYKDKVNAKFADYKKNLQLPGFRKGKIPSTLIKNQKKRMILEEADAIINERFQSYLKENKIEFFLKPIFIPLQRSDSKHNNLEFRYKVNLHVKPKIEFDLNVIKELVRYEVEVEEVDIDREISRIRHLNVFHRVAENFDAPDNLIFQLSPDAKTYPNLPKSILIEYNDIEHDDYKKLLLNNRESGTLINLPYEFILGDRFEDYNEEYNEGKLMPEDTIEIELKKVVERYLPEISIEMIFNEFKFLKKKNYGNDIEIRELIREALEFIVTENSSHMNYKDVVYELNKRHKIDISREFFQSWVLHNIETIDPDYNEEFWGDTEDNNESPDPERVKNLTDEVLNEEVLFLIAQRLSEQLDFKASTDKDLYEKEFIKVVADLLTYSKDLPVDTSGNLKEEWMRSNWRVIDAQARGRIYYGIIARSIEQEKLCKTKKITMTNLLDRMASKNKKFIYSRDQIDNFI